MIDWIIALEGGGTRCQAVAMDPAGEIRGKGTGGDVNTNFTSFSQAQSAVRQAVHSALRSAGISGAEVSCFASALVGPRFGQETFGELLPNTRYRFYGESDVVFARAGVYRPYGVGFVSSTGATAWGVRSDPPQRYACGGWGSLLGDEGSAYALGEALLRASSKAWEGRLGLPTAIPQALAEHFGLNPANFHQEMVQKAYQPALSRAEVASAAVVGTRLAAQGDPAAVLLVQRCAEDLANLVLHCAKRLFKPEEDFVLIGAGGMTSAGELILAPTRRAFAEHFPLVQLVIGSQEPAEAMAKLARYDLSIEKENAA